MANIKVKDADASDKYLKTTGAGSDVDPHIPEHLETNSAAIQTAVEAIQTAVELIDNMISGSEAQVDVVSSALPTGAATAANQSTGNTALAAIQTAVELIDNMISGSEAQVDVVAALPAGTNTIGKVGIVPQTSGGYSVYRDIDLDETGISIKGSAGQICGWFIYNLASAKRYIKFYDDASAPTVGTDTPILTIPLEADQGVVVELVAGVPCSNGIGIGATTGLADADTGAPGANEVVVNVFYK